MIHYKKIPIELFNPTLLKLNGGYETLKLPNFRHPIISNRVVLFVTKNYDFHSLHSINKLITKLFIMITSI